VSPNAIIEELEEEKQFLLGSLRELRLEHEAGEISDEDYESLRGTTPPERRASCAGSPPLRRTLRPAREPEGRSSDRQALVIGGADPRATIPSH